MTEKTKLDNSTYNILRALGKEADFLYSTVDKYIEDANKDNRTHLVEIWNEMKRDKEKHLRMLREALQKEAGEQKLNRALVNKQKLEEKIGEAIGLEMAAQKAVKILSSKGLLPDGSTAKNKLEGMRKEANNHQTQIEEMVTKLTKSEGLDSSKIQEMAKETEQKATKIMETYLGEDPDSQEALEFLCLAEGGEVTHYEALSAMTKDMKDKQMKTRINSILEEEQKHLLLCTQLAKKNAIAISSSQ